MRAKLWPKIKIDPTDSDTRAQNNIATRINWETNAEERIIQGATSYKSQKRGNLTCTMMMTDMGTSGDPVRSMPDTLGLMDTGNPVSDAEAILAQLKSVENAILGDQSFEFTEDDLVFFQTALKMAEDRLRTVPRGLENFKERITLREIKKKSNELINYYNDTGDKNERLF